MTRPPRLAGVGFPVLAALAAILLESCGGGPGRPATTARPQASPIIGRWEGRLHQRGLASFRVSANIRSLDAGGANTVAYSGIDCSGNWRYLGRRGPAFRFQEVIRRGRGGSCKGVGIVTLTPKRSRRLDYRFQGGGVESWGVLSPARS